jgi:hypothetical protein
MVSYKLYNIFFSADGDKARKFVVIKVGTEQID